MVARRNRLSPSGPFTGDNFYIANFGGGGNADPVPLATTPNNVASSFVPTPGTIKAGDLILAWFNVRCLNTADGGLRLVTVEVQINGVSFGASELPLDVLSNAPANERIIVGQGFGFVTANDPTITLVATQNAGTDVVVPAEGAFFDTLALRPVAAAP